ncbi:MAG TPA: ABC transporter permease, partial [Thermoplasmata archaeon]|nr:ABC transporter permease [Thermoplasmata archaeon]
FISLIREYASRVWGILFGDLLLITERDLVLLLVATSLVVVCTLLFHREFVFISFDMEGAIAYGVRARALNYLMLGLIAVSIVVLLKGVGAILVFAMLVSPAATANRLARSVPRVFGLAFLLALFSGYCGLVSSFLVAVSPGAIASLIATALYFIVLTVRR